MNQTPDGPRAVRAAAGAGVGKAKGGGAKPTSRRNNLQSARRTRIKTFAQWCQTQAPHELGLDPDVVSRIVRAMSRPEMRGISTLDGLLHALRWLKVFYHDSWRGADSCSSLDTCGWFIGGEHERIYPQPQTIATMAGAKRRALRRPRLTQLTEESIAAYRDGDRRRLAAALNQAPWEISPLDAHLRCEPDLTRCRDEHRIYLSTWRKARQLRDQFLAILGVVR
jgi:hypothetical protein